MIALAPLQCQNANCSVVICQKCLEQQNVSPNNHIKILESEEEIKEAAEIKEHAVEIETQETMPGEIPQAIKSSESFNLIQQDVAVMEQANVKCIKCNVGIFDQCSPLQVELYSNAKFACPSSICT